MKNIKYKINLNNTTEIKKKSYQNACDIEKVRNYQGETVDKFTLTMVLLISLFNPFFPRID